MADGRRTDDWRLREAGRHMDPDMARRDYRDYRDYDDESEYSGRGEERGRHLGDGGRYMGDGGRRQWEGGHSSYDNPRAPGRWNEAGRRYTTDRDRPSRDYRGAVGRGGYGGRERNWMDKAGDEVQSWFGDDDAAQRRDMDRRRDGHYGKGPRGYRRSDDRIAEDVNDRLTDDWRLDASEISVSVSEGEVTLSGTVMSREDKRRAEDLADSVSGVSNVQNNLRIDRGSATDTPPTMGSITGGGG